MPLFTSYPSRSLFLSPCCCCPFYFSPSIKFRNKLTKYQQRNLTGKPNPRHPTNRRQNYHQQTPRHQQQQWEIILSFDILSQRSLRFVAYLHPHKLEELLHSNCVHFNSTISFFLPFNDLPRIFHCATNHRDNTNKFR